MVFVTFRGILYDSSVINLVDSGWEDNFTQSYSPITLQTDFFIEKVFEVSQSVLWKMSMEADETKFMVNSCMLCERFAVVSNFH